MLTSTNNAVRQADFDQGKACGLLDSMPPGRRCYAADILFAQRRANDPKAAVVTDATFTGWDLSYRIFEGA